MVKLKRTTLCLFLCLALIALAAGSVFATDFEVVYVYFDDGTDIVRVDYKQAVKEAFQLWPRDRTLYDATSAGVRDALANFRGVWIEVITADETSIVIDYSELVLNPQHTLAQAVNDAALGYQTARPAFTRELIRVNGEAEKLPTEQQAWLDQIVVVWAEYAQAWMVDIILDGPGVAALGAAPANWEGVEKAWVRGYFESATGDRRPISNIQFDPDNIDPDNKLRLRFFVEDTKSYTFSSQRDTLVVNFRHILIKVDGVTYGWTGEVDEPS